MNKKFNNKGFGLVEIVIGVAVLSIFLGGIFFSIFSLFSYEKNNLLKAKAHTILIEGLEVVRIIRDDDWQNISNLNSGEVYGLVWDGFGWSIGQLDKIDNRFYRSVYFDDVYRGGDGRIDSQGNIDDETKLVRVSVEWLNNRGATSSIEANTYLVNLND